ncbi:MAG: hypothetical protein C0514_00965 [Candidatus Puniceispirillum sp.]|nr:hypothetical protein [Candidatus Puniceispirillum sp.]
MELDYDRMVQKALMQVVRESLVQTAEKGLMGSHHFYITFQTNRPDVVMPASLREKYPEEMTIVLQHQFWDLKVTANNFSVTLSFDDKHEVLTIPFGAVINFLDPSVKFGLQFEPVAPAPASDNGGTAPKGEGKGKKTPSKVVALDTFRKK